MKNIIAQVKNQEQHNSDIPVYQQKTETVVRNKVLWQKNILPGGSVDWVIVGFGAPKSVKKKVDAEVDTSKDFEDKKAPGEVVTTAIPSSLEDTVRKNEMGFIIQQDSKESAVEAFKVQEAVTTKFVTNEIHILKKAKFENEVVEMSFGSPNYLDSREAMIGLADGAKQMLLKGSRNRSVNDSSLTAEEILQSSKGLSQAISATHTSWSVKSEMESGGPGLGTHNVRGSKAKSSSLTPMSPRSNHQPCIALPNSSPSGKQHPAEILKSWSSINTNTSNNYTHNTKGRLTTSVSPTTKRSPVMRPKTSASVASRMIKRGLGL
ncbi:hypothetical protein MFRU_033g00250 [Monilinia fructicola]|uniref:Uncharacterized protein n=1 Tax=Monilinia fructicola TaxID=38448 RepID=A0A5M9K506_MONFR|nr:hypothetical protein EYC84_006173 [Monilinia fructicola]KAG4027054.1 hypothetical protein MFRU_033g00250 [Monilinia fructicola]